MRSEKSLSYLARMGFADLEWADEQLNVVSTLGGVEVGELIESLRSAADPDQALALLALLLRRAAEKVIPVLAQPAYRSRLVRVLGASKGLGDFFARHPGELVVLADSRLTLPSADEARTALLESVDAADGFSAECGEAAWTRLRVRYRGMLARVAAFDLEQEDPAAGLDRIAAVLADLAAAALEASLAVARSTLSTKGLGLWYFEREDVKNTCLAIIGMGKAGARELNYVSDVDVIFVGEADPSTELPQDRHADDARHQRVRPRAGAVGGRPQPSTRGQRRGARAFPRLAHRLLRPLGEELGVPGSAEGKAARRRCGTRSTLRRGGRSPRLVECLPGRLRRVGAAHA
jgi:glutamate-ammonia-ligase adenylyltransferase